MENKPFHIQDPQQLAQDYGGNKQKLAQAAQMGIVDPTAAVLAGMFIDRMRSAATLEQAPQQTVAQQVLAPTPQAPPAGGLGATPPAAGMAPPMGAAPQMSAPAPTPDMSMPAPEMPPQGAVPGMAEGGLTTLPVPDGMFDEPSNGGYSGDFAGGGLVAFAGAGEVEDPEVSSPLIDELKLPTFDEYVSRAQERMAPMGGPMLEKYRQSLAGGEEKTKARKKEDLWQTLAEIGFGTAAGTSGNALQNIAQGFAGAMPNMGERLKERRAAEAEALKGGAQLEMSESEYKNKALEIGSKLQENEQRLANESLDRKSRENIEAQNRALQLKLKQMDVGATLQAARISASRGDTKPLDDFHMLYATKLQSLRAINNALPVSGPQGGRRLREDAIQLQAADYAARMLHNQGGASIAPNVQNREPNPPPGASVIN